MSGDPIPPSVRRYCYERDQYLCQNPHCQQRDKVKTLPDGTTIWQHRYWDEMKQVWRQKRITLHHCLFRSQYRSFDVHEPWNLKTMCLWCHRQLHDGDTELRDWCEQLALAQRPSGTPEKRREKLEQRQKRQKKRDGDRRRRAYRKQVEAFKKKNGGLSPAQVAYRRKKTWKQNNP